MSDTVQKWNSGRDPWTLDSHDTSLIRVHRILRSWQLPSLRSHRTNMQRLRGILHKCSDRRDKADKPSSPLR